MFLYPLNRRDLGLFYKRSKPSLCKQLCSLVSQIVGQGFIYDMLQKIYFFSWGLSFFRDISRVLGKKFPSLW